jgi:lauroyl/myristoyl acyltransferase
MYLLIRFLAAIFSRLSPECSLFIARLLGEVYFLLDSRHRKIAYRNLQLALASYYSPEELRRILKQHYINLAQNFVEVLYSPKINSSYIEKYIKIEGREYLDQSVKKNQAAIFTTAHFGSWEIANIVCRHVFPDRPYVVLVKEQRKSASLAAMLDFYRLQHGYKIVSTERKGLRELINNVREGALLGMVIDQGVGESQVFINFFNHRVPAPAGAVKLALNFEIPIFLTYIRRLNGPNLLLKIYPASQAKKDNADINQVQELTQMINKRSEEFIREFPQNYMWQFKRFKNRIDRKILILDDGKAGHLRQSQATAEILKNSLTQKGLLVKNEIIDIEFKSKFSLSLLAVILKFLGPGFGFSYLKNAVSKQCFKKLYSNPGDFVISAGSSLACLNLILSRYNQAKSITILTPSIINTKNFDLVISPEHDPIGQAKNVVKINGSANLIDEDYLAKNSSWLRNKFSVDNNPQRLKIGLLIGGDTKNFKLTVQLVTSICDQVLSVARELNAEVLLTSSRRTSKEVEDVLRQKFSGQSLCKLLVIANENNLPEAVGGILGMCQIVIVSGDSISMVSEAASSGKYIVVFGPDLKGKTLAKHQRFLFGLKEKGFIYFSDTQIQPLIRKLWQEKPLIKKLDNNLLIRQALERII